MSGDLSADIDALSTRMKARLDRIEDLLGRVEKILRQQRVRSDPDGALVPMRPAGSAQAECAAAAADERRSHRDAALISALRFS